MGGASEMPGPGAYDNENRNTFVALLARKRFGRAGAFGSKSKRCIPPLPPTELEGVPTLDENVYMLLQSWR